MSDDRATGKDGKRPSDTKEKGLAGDKELRPAENKGG